MTKEVLTTENIKKDLRKRYSKKIKGLLLDLLLIPLANVIVLNLVLLFYNPGGSFKTIFSVVFCAVIFLIYSCDVISTIKGLRQIENGNFTITSDWVIDKKPMRHRHKVGSSTPYRLIFALSGTYNIPYGKSYQWSELFSTWDETLYEYTDINEDFYVISVGNEKNIIAYRKKHFELKE